MTRAALIVAGVILLGTLLVLLVLLYLAREVSRTITPNPKDTP